MKFSCTQENLNRGLAIVSHITGKDANLPILHNVLISAKDEGIELAATNLEIGVRTTVRGKVEAAGEFTVPAQVFSSYVGLLQADRVDIEQQENNLSISAGNQQTKLRGEEAAEFPLIPVVERTGNIRLSVSECKQAFAQVVLAASHDEARPELTGVMMKLKGNSLTIAATDSYRLAERVLHFTGDALAERTVIIPANALSELVRMLPEKEDAELEIFVSDTQALFATEDIELTTRLIEGSFPDYQQIIPATGRTEAVLERTAFVRGIKAASLFSKAGIHDVNIHLSPEKQTVTLTTVNAQLGENVTKVEGELTGDSNNIIFNYRYLLDGLNAIGTPKVRLSIIDNASPGVFRPYTETPADGYIYIIMPIKQ